ncbi:cupin [Brachybacterium avium]|uniref:Cupin n=1 Tax=Brachybacterium avium TaxID=2017485 RepID=A0A220UBG3_9MICO|nr:cupin domain-containing protein [Brachybacterium avium]ASK65261.1 cupin [Brachybacterium avium]
MEKLELNATNPGPGSSFTGEVFMEAIRGPLDGSRAAMSHVHFTPGARTHWHWHPAGQTLYGTGGVGLVVTRSGEVLTLEPGRTVWIPPREEHWHGALDTSLMSHLAVQEADEDDETVIWLEPVSDEEFARANEVARTA